MPTGNCQASFVWVSRAAESHKWEGLQGNVFTTARKQQLIKLLITQMTTEEKHVCQDQKVIRGQYHRLICSIWHHHCRSNGFGNVWYVRYIVTVKLSFYMMRKKKLVMNWFMEDPHQSILGGITLERWWIRCHAERREHHQPSPATWLKEMKSRWKKSPVGLQLLFPFKQ